MRFTKMVYGSMILSLIALSGCGTHQASPTTQGQQGQSAQQKNSNGGQSSSATSNSNNGQSQQNNNNSSSAQSSQSNGNDSSNSDGGASSSKSSNNGQTQAAPTTEHQALKDIASALNTRVPLILPTSVPVSSGKYLTGTTTSQTWYYKTQLTETSKPAKINSEAAANGAAIATVEGTEYSSEAKAKAAINGYMQVDPSKENTIDLGNGIKAAGLGAMGHAYIIWNEGRWCIRVDHPTDPSYQSKAYPNSKKVAKDVVAYLHSHALPSPQKIGVITINLWNNSTKTTVQWQYHEMTYQVTSENPLNAVKVATAMRFVSH